jgi:hypothetical protein
MAGSLIAADVIALKALQHQRLPPRLLLHLSFRDPHLPQGSPQLHIPARKELVSSCKYGHL